MVARRAPPCSPPTCAFALPRGNDTLRVRASVHALAPLMLTLKRTADRLSYTAECTAPSTQRLRRRVPFLSSRRGARQARLSVEARRPGCPPALLRASMYALSHLRSELR